MRISTTAFGALLLTSIVTQGCDEDDAECTPQHVVTIAGLPAGVNHDVTVTYGTTTRPAVSGEIIRTDGNAAPTVSAKIVTAADPIVRTAYAATTSVATTSGNSCGTNTTVTYAPIATSNKLWHINDQPAQMLGFASASLAATGAPAATIAAKAPAGKAIAFDREGNLWAPGSADISRYPAASLAASGDKTPDRVIGFDPQCAPGVNAIAFDKDGNLWATVGCGQRVSRLAASDLGASGAPVPGVVIGGMNGPEGLAFDKDGNLWIADAGAGTLLRYDAGRLPASSNDAANFVLTPQNQADAALPPNHLAFDKDGNLWVSSFTANTLYKLLPGDLVGIGPRTVKPAVQIGLAVDVLPEGLALDESGSLWLTLSQGKIGRLGTSLLGTSTAPGAPATPDVIVTSPDIGYSVAPAFFPSAKGTPLYAALP